MSAILDSLRPYQDRASDTLVNAVVDYGFGLDASSTGLGKTYSSLAMVEKCEAPQFLVICRAVARTKWKNTIAELGMSNRCIAVDSWDRFRGGRLTDYVIRQQHHKLAKATYSWGPLKKDTVVIFDEAQDAGGFRTANAELLVGAVRTSQAYPLCLSASVADSPLRMYAVGFAAGMHHGISDYHNWCRRNGCSKSPFGGLYFKKCGRKKNGAPHRRGCDCGERAVINEMHEHLFPKYGVMVTYDDAKLDLPPESIAVELWDIPKSLPKELRKFEEAIEAKEAEDLLKADEGANIGAVEYIRERQRAELYKMPGLANELIEATHDGLACPVFLSHSGSIDALAVLLTKAGVRFGILDGRDKKRAAASHENFQVHHRIDVLVTQTQAGSASIDMHDEVGNRPRKSYVSPFPSAEKMIQALGRSYRVNLKSPVMQTIFFAAGTVEEDVYKVVKRRARNIRAMSTGEWEDSWN